MFIYSRHASKMSVARFRRDGTSTAAAAVRHAAAGTPPGWSQRAASRALKAGKRYDGVYAVELRPGGRVRYTDITYLLWRGGPDGQAGRVGDERENIDSPQGRRGESQRMREQHALGLEEVD